MCRKNDLRKNINNAFFYATYEYAILGNEQLAWYIAALSWMYVQSKKSLNPSDFNEWINWEAHYMNSESFFFKKNTFMTLYSTATIILYKKN
jgi:hypothetical protein